MAERLALQRDDHLVGRGEPVDGEDPERGRAVDEHDVEAVADGLEGAAERVLAPGAGQEVDLRAGEVDGRGQHDERPEVDDDVGGVGPTDQHVVQRAWSSPSGSRPERVREAGLGVEVDQQHPVAELGHAAPRVWTVVVLATPPFWLATASTRATGRSVLATVNRRREAYRPPPPCSRANAGE